MIKLKQMSKSYGNFPAVVNVSFEVQKGEVVGFLGPNGAGKTTTMRVITGFTPPSSGKVTIAGYNVLSHSLEIRHYIGYLPETVPLYNDMEVTEYLVYMGQLRGMRRNHAQQRATQVIDLVRLGDYRKTLVGRLSKGYRQRTGIAQAIIHEPEILILDEPTIGIDPIQVVETRNLIRDLGSEHTLLVSSHILPEINAICQRVLVINDGRIIAADTPQTLSKKLQSFERVSLQISGEQRSKIVETLQHLPFVTDVRSSAPAREEDANLVGLFVDTKPNMGAAQKIAEVIVNNNWGLAELSPITMTLEDIFLHLTQESKE